MKKPNISTEKIKTKMKKTFSKKNLKRNLVICSSIAIIGGAIYLNWGYLNSENTNADVLSGAQELASNEEAESYFAMTEINRQRSREEAMEVLQVIVDNEATAEADRTAALNTINSIASCIEQEGNIESLVESKGFSECVAVISEENATVVVESDGLMENEITQIQEIVYVESGIDPQNLRIIEKQ